MGLSALLLRLGLVACTLAAAAPPPPPKVGCDNECGDLIIPYPFGTNESCFKDPTFFINCTISSSGHPIAYLRKSNIQVLDISVDTSEMRVSSWLGRDCYDHNGSNDRSRGFFTIQEFSISHTKNKFTAVGCDTFGYISDLTGDNFQGCMSICNNLTTVTNGSCSGVGCCQTTFPKGIMSYNVTVSSFYNHSSVLDFNPCSYAFVAEDGSFNFTTQDLLNLSNRTKSPVVLNWAVDGQTCVEAQKNTSSYACVGNSECQDSESEIGYFCKCKQGFEGNPYLSFPDGGCQDVDECSSDALNNCSDKAVCHNLNGSYTCSCPRGDKGDGLKNGTGCTRDTSNLILIISLGVSVALLFVFTLVSTLCWAQKQRTLKQLRQRNFEQNGGNMLLQQLSQQEGYNERTKIFTEIELNNATNNFDESRILGCGGQGIVYKGILLDHTPVAIKKFRVGGDPRHMKDFINEVFVLSQINHRNVVKLLGCCLETEVPLLVYEFVENGTLLDHIDPLKNECSNITWDTQLRIATETAGAISYLHSYASIPIIHRDIKSSNILLDHNDRAKVSDFGASRLFHLEETHVATVVQGTIGYLDPEYLQTGQLNEKSDVYSFGVVLVEVLTGKKATEFNKLAAYFISSMREDRLWEILDMQVIGQKKNAIQLKEVALLARRCLKVNGEERPNMKEVVMELEGLTAIEKRHWGKDEDMTAEESEYLLGHVSDAYGGASASITVAGYDNIQKQAAFEIANGR